MTRSAVFVLQVLVLRVSSFQRFQNTNQFVSGGPVRDYR
jgi:hypothetical protein